MKWKSDSVLQEIIAIGKDVAEQKVATKELHTDVKESKYAFSKHCQREQEFQVELTKRLAVCPIEGEVVSQQGHIKEQNGKLDRLAIKATAIESKFSVWIKIITIIFGAILSGVIAIVIKFYLHH